jgi:hypothetical protein
MPTSSEPVTAANGTPGDAGGQDRAATSRRSMLLLVGLTVGAIAVIAFIWYLNNTVDDIFSNVANNLAP